MASSPSMGKAINLPTPQLEGGESDATVSFCLLIIISLIFASKLIRSFLSYRWCRCLRRFVSDAVMNTLVGILFGVVLSRHKAVDITNTLGKLFEGLFMTLLLPTILFTSAIKMNKLYFFKNLKCILLFAFVGTTASIAAHSVLMFLITFLAPEFAPSFHYCLVFAIIVSSTDTVGLIGSIDESLTDPNAYSIIFGESLLNDAVSLSFFRSIVFEDSENIFPLLKSIGANFAYIVVASMALGLVVSFCGAYLVKRRLKFARDTEMQLMDLKYQAKSRASKDPSASGELVRSSEHIEESKFLFKGHQKETGSDFELGQNQQQSQAKAKDEHSSLEANRESSSSFSDGGSFILDENLRGLYDEYRHAKKKFKHFLQQQLAILLLTPLLCYLLAESLEVSGIVAILTCGIGISRYTIPIINRRSRKLMEQISSSITELFESIAFLMIGTALFAFSFDLKSLTSKFLILNFVALFFSRVLAIYFVCFIAKAARVKTIKGSLKRALIVSGVRGSVSFALAISNARNKFGGEFLVMTNVFAVASLFLASAGSNCVSRASMADDAAKTADEADRATLTAKIDQKLLNFFSRP